ncbi:MAG: sigma-54-dependent Fis family transcriptional regulator, partial [Candidatus Scalindua sp.]|nr:sigma-54-dependent Fis family transcriptional regulator [Candidatus Scalindua sp.]
LFHQENKGKPTLKNIKAKYAALPVIMLTSTMVDTYVDADYPGRAFPYPKDALKPEEEKSYKNFARKIRETIEGTDNIENYIGKFKELGLIVGNTRAMKDACRMVLNAKNTDSAVFITGETGTGKELIAKAIHQLGKRKDNQIVSFNCAALSETLIESELFGHEKGAFTDARERRPGKFELADKGTIFLDEIGDMSPNTQSKILRVLQEQSFERLGGTETIHVDVRVISATHRNLFEEIKKGNFREDLYFRLNVVQIDVPPLRDRTEDIEVLYKHFVNELKTKLHKEEIIDTLRPQLKGLFKNYNWPGNIREFRLSIERAINYTNSAILMEGDFSLKGSLENNENTFGNTEEIIQDIWNGRITWEDLKKEFTKKGMQRGLVFKGLVDRWLSERKSRPEYSDLAKLLKTTNDIVRQQFTKCKLSLEKHWPKRME